MVDGVIKCLVHCDRDDVFILLCVWVYVCVQLYRHLVVPLYTFPLSFTFCFYCSLSVTVSYSHGSYSCSDADGHNIVCVRMPALQRAHVDFKIKFINMTFLSCASSFLAIRAHTQPGTHLQSGILKIYLQLPWQGVYKYQHQSWL